MNHTQRKKVLIVGLTTLFSLAGAAILSVVGLQGINGFIPVKGSTSEYELVLDSTNKVTSAGDKVQKTKLGNDVTFTYSGVASSTSGHVTLNNGGSLVNKDIIHSIEDFTVEYTGTGLKGYLAYVSGKYSDAFSIVSGQTVQAGSHPYFVKFEATSGAVTINSIRYTYNCSVNSDAETQETSGSYAITFAANGSDSSSDIGSASSTIMAQVTSGTDYISSFSDGSRIYAGKNGLKFGASGGPGNLTINFNSTNVKEKITSIDVATAQYSSDTGKFNFYVNGSSSATQLIPSEGGLISVNANLTSLEIETTSKRAYLCGLTLNYGGTVEPGEPEAPTYIVGFEAEDSKKNDYTTNSIFANENALVVKTVNSLGEKNNTSDYTYVIKDSNDQTIDPNQKFPAEGQYTLYVSYGNYIPAEITLNVGEYVYMTDITASMTNVSFTTADILANKLTNNLIANLEYSNDTESNDIPYSDFAANKLAIVLTTPKGIAHNISNPFGTAGTWTLKVYNTEDENMYYNISLTVSAIPVTSISLNMESHSMKVDEQVQLTATVNPNNATNQAYVWSSNNDEVASVDENGLVTANAVGGAIISATALDGSGVVGSCSITVTAKPKTVDYNIDATTTTQVTTSSTSTVVFTNSPVTVTIAKSSSSTNANNYIATGTTAHSRVYNGQRFTISANGNAISSIVIHGTSDKGVSGFTSPTWTNASKSSSGNEVTLTPTDPESDVYATISGTSSFSGITVTCGSDAPDPVYPTSISLTAEESTVSIGATTQLTVGYTPSDTNVKNVTYSSSNESVATVSSTGLVTGVTQGSVTITAQAEAANNTKVSATTNITITPISVISVSLSSNSETIKVGKSVTLTPTINPSNATNKSVTWSSSNTSIATVSNGVVTGAGEGTATITVRTVDGNKTATCTVVVQPSGAAGEETFSISYTDLPTTYQTGSTVYTADSGIKFQAYNCANYSSKMQFKASSGYLQTTEELELQSITINDRESNTLTVYGSNTAGSFSTEITGNNDVYDLTGYSYFKVARTVSGAAYCSSITVVTGTPTPTDPTSIILSPTSCELAPNGTKDLSVSYVPSNANQNKEITWTSSNTSVATVADGKISVKSTATAGQKATITARLTNITSIYATCLVTVVEQSKDDHTVLIYMCGADLESENQLATGDIQEILKVSGQPDDVNIVIETGGAKSWASTYGISSTYLERYHVEGKSLVRDSQLTYASMGLTSTLQSFIEYGLNNFPAERTGLVFWNHGGGMRGVCYDEKKNDDVLKNSEIRSALSGALSNCGMSGQKLEWVGYDACLMAVQDIAVTNAEYFNYMIASEESEAGYGWDYDTWVDDLYSKKTTTTILKAIVDGFIADNGGASSGSGDQTLSYLNLSYAAAYKTAWENLAAQLNSKVTTSNKSSFNSAITSNVKHYADSDYDYFCTFDAWDFVDKLASNSAFSNYRVDSSYTTAVKNAHANLVAYNLAQKGAGVSKGLCMYWPNSTQYSDVSTYYTTSETTLTTWRTFCVNKGTHA